jgi:formylmethanofuran dehydrogenase subunit C
MKLNWLRATMLTVEGDALSADRLEGLSLDEVRAVRLPVGQGTGSVGELFDVVEDGQAAVTIVGDMRNVQGIGRGQRSGELIVRDAYGPFLGAGMSGGSIEVSGAPGDWIGAGMSGGEIRALDDAGHHLGAALPGARLGMTGGTIVVYGAAGEGIGERMRRGLIVVALGSGPSLGRGMIAGTIATFGPASPYPGLGMKRGTIVLLGRSAPELLPSFAPAGEFRLPFVGLLLRRVGQEYGIGDSPEISVGPLRRYNGDLAEGGLGEILVRPAAGGG